MSGDLHSVLAPYGLEAVGSAEIAWVLFVGGGIILAAVVLLAALAIFSPRPWLASRELIIAGGIVLPTVVLSALLIYSLLAQPRPPLAGGADVVIEVVGHQWWWELNYLDDAGQKDFASANEIHIPAGKVIEFRLRSADVLHSFWVPSLAGKLDLIPGKDNRLRLSAQAPGVFRGICAEYCGGAHAQMLFQVVAHTPAEFEAWRARQRLPAAAGGSGELGRGREVFLARCAACHAVRGTAAEGKLGPDLTHFGSRRSLGAGILPRNEASVAAWIVGSQNLKPGNLMPELRFDSDELRALVAYLESLE